MSLKKLLCKLLGHKGSPYSAVYWHVAGKTSVGTRICERCGQSVVVAVNKVPEVPPASDTTVTPDEASEIMARRSGLVTPARGPALSEWQPITTAPGVSGWYHARFGIRGTIRWRYFQKAGGAQCDTWYCPDSDRAVIKGTLLTTPETLPDIPSMIGSHSDAQWRGVL